jgi:F0F1-type ATP synthase membrane subunit b/b'
MNINATIFVQAINFFIVYCLLRSFLFKPVISIIDSGHAEDLKLLGIIAQQKKDIAIQEKELDDYWQTCREYFQAHRPSLQQSRQINVENSSASGQSSFSCASDDEIVHLTQQTYNRLAEKIKNVH